MSRTRASAAIGAVALLLVAVTQAQSWNGTDEVAWIGRDLPRNWVVNTTNATATTFYEQTFSVPGAIYVQVHFSQFHLADGDAVVLRDGLGNVITQYTGLGRGNVGMQGGFYSPMIAGTNVTVRYRPSVGVVSNPSRATVSYGFTVDKIVRSALSAQSRTICGSDDAKAPKCYVQTGISAFEQIYPRAQGVAHLVIGGWACTGFLVGPSGHLLTAAHCLDDLSLTTIANMDVRFGFESPLCDAQCQGRDYLKCLPTPAPLTAKLLAVNLDLDYALIKLNGTTNPAMQYGFMQLRAGEVFNNEPVFVPEHSNGLAKVVSATNDDGDFVRAKLNVFSDCPNCINYNADTGAGASGSPVVGSRDNAVVALHVAGGSADYPCLNAGMSMQAIVADLKLKGELPSGATA